METPPAGQKEDNKGNKETSQELWEEIGFHRPLGGYMYNYILGFIGLIFGVVVGGLLISLLYPYPESKGYRDLAAVVFVWAMPFIDFGVAFGIERFIGEWRVKDQAKMLEYIRFFMWYNLFSSLVKTTMMSIWTFMVIKNGNLAYLSWNLLFLAIKHYPGILNMLKSCLVGFQQYHKASLLNTIGSEIMDKVFLLVFIFWWRDIGNSNPALGELMTMAFGTTFAYYMRDFFMFGLQIYVIKPILKGMGIELRSLFLTEISKDTIKSSLKGGLSVSVINIIGTLMTYFIIMLYVGHIVNYTTLSVLSATAMSFINFIDYFGKIDLTAPFTEAFRNGKKHLSSYYIAQIWKYWGYVNGAMLFTFVAFLDLLAQTILAIPGLENYALIGFFLLPAWIYKFFLPLAEQGDTIIVSSRRLKQFQIFRIIEEILKISWVFLLFYVLKWHLQGITAVAYVLIIAGAFPQWIKDLIDWIYIKKYLISYQIPIWQAIVAPFLSGTIVYFIITFLLKYTHPFLLHQFGVLGAGIMIIVFTLIIFPPIIFPFFYGLLGGWDDFGLKVFQKSASISGPSRIFYNAGAKLTTWAAKHSFLTNKFAIPYREAEEEIQALMEIKKNRPIEKKM
jgi:hypothetical protein